MFCEKCGKQLPDGSAFCDGCGAPVSAAPVEAAPVEAETPVEPTATVETATATAEKKPLNTKTLIGIVAVVAVILCIIIIIAVAGGGSDAPLLYVTDGELVHNTNIKKNTTFTVDEKYISSEVSRYGDAADFAQEQADLTAFTENYKKFVYLGNYDSDDDTYTLYWVATKNLDKSGDSVTKVASGVDSFKLASETDALIYLKDSKLYYYDFKNDPVLISKDVVGSYSYYGGYISSIITSDGKYVCYGKEGDEYSDLYVYDVKAGEATKIDSDVYKMYYYDTDNGFALMAYSKYSDGTESLYAAGRTNEKEKVLSKADWIISANPNGYCFYVTEGDDGYELNRLDFNTTDKVELTDSYCDYVNVNALKGVIIYSEYDKDYDTTYYISVSGGDPAEVDEVVKSAVIDDSMLYTVEVEDGDSEGELVSYKLGSTGVSDRTKLAEDVYSVRFINETVCYFTDYDSGDYTGTLNVWNGKSGTKLADEVSPWSLTATEDGFVFFDDLDDDEGTLYLYDGKNATKVATDAYYYGYVEFDDDLLYLTDFDEDDGGTLYQWNGKDKTKIASDVQAVIPVK
jgi:hypothetical protein